MAKRKIVWTETAAKQRREILKYWTERNKRTTYAEQLIEITAKHLKVISKNPEAFKESEIDEVRESAMGYSAYTIKSLQNSLLLWLFGIIVKNRKHY